jgi:hypothetical protein
MAVGISISHADNGNLWRERTRETLILKYRGVVADLIDIDARYLELGLNLRL